jgi:hypothetical protein
VSTYLLKSTVRNANFHTAAVAEAIEYETVVFKVSGGGTREHPITPYEGPPTPEKDMRWYELMDGNSITQKVKIKANNWKSE